MNNQFLNRNPFTLQVRQGPSADLSINSTIYSLHSGEPLWTTDTFNLYMSDGTNLYLIGGVGHQVYKNSGTLTAGTTTTVTNANAKTTSVIILQATSSAFTTLGAYISTKSNGSFVITTTIAAGTETFDYEIIN